MTATLNAAEVLAIHDVLTADFAAELDPISPPGVKSISLLESAISRQFTGYLGRLKYEHPVLNAASLTYGICCNHPFHNGNKRTSLVAMLCHLDKNDYTIKESISHEELYDFMLKIARHGFVERTAQVDRSDEEVDLIAKWIRSRVRRVERGERIVTYRQLKGILISHGYVFEDLRDNSVDLVRYEEKKSWLPFSKTKIERRRIMRMSYPGDGIVAGKSLLRDIRSRCQLSESDGIDSHSFYSKERPSDYFITKYRGTLRRLARV
jgi:death-on-curing protein